MLETIILCSYSVLSLSNGLVENFCWPENGTVAFQMAREWSETEDKDIK